jgi:hypothetical protein
MSKCGRPTKYRAEYCTAILEYFNIPATTTAKITRITKRGTEIVDVETANPLPTIEGFAKKIGVSKQSVITWTQEHPAFLDAYTRAKTSQKEILVQNGLMGRYCEGFAKFVAINCTDMVDKSSKELSGPDGGRLVIEVVKYAAPQESE